jgi:hypothetical protein
MLNYTFEKTVLYSEKLGDWDVKYGYPTGPYTDSLPKEFVKVYVHGFALALAGEDEFWTILVPSERLLEVHKALQKAYALQEHRWQQHPKVFPEGRSYLHSCTHAEIALKAVEECLPSDWQEWNEMYNKAPEASSEFLKAVAIVFSIRIPGAIVKEETYKKAVEVFAYGRMVFVPIESGYMITYEGEEYHSNNFKLFVPLGGNDIKTRQSLVISGLQQVLMHIAKKYDL